MSILNVINLMTLFEDVCARKSYFEFFLITFLNLETSLSLRDAVCFIKQQKCVYTSTGSSQVRVYYRAVLLELVQIQRVNLIYLFCLQATSPSFFVITAVNLFIKLRDTMCLMVNMDGKLYKPAN